MIEDATGMSVIIDNGANMAALAEYIYGEGKGSDNLAYINCGMGIRTGSISSGTVVRTINGTEDAFGHMVIDVDGELCSCGNYGCVECYSSIPAIVGKFARELKKGRVTAVGGVRKMLTTLEFAKPLKVTTSWQEKL
jgi:predicted NBD/HSP70 family sugar kinase